MTIQQRACAGTLESSDAFVEIEPADSGLTVQVESVVEKQFGGAIRAAVFEVLDTLGVQNAQVRVTDRGALECVIRARVETAVRRGNEVL